MKNWEYFRTSAETMALLAVQKVVLREDVFYVVNGFIFFNYDEAVNYANQWLRHERQEQTTSGQLGILGEC
jgi:hypothetical protein